jgi:hypothetical protein
MKSRELVAKRTKSLWASMLTLAVHRVHYEKPSLARGPQHKWSPRHPTVRNDLPSVSAAVITIYESVV